MLDKSADREKNQWYDMTIWSTCKMRNETKRNKYKRNLPKRNEIDRNETKRNNTK